MQAPPESETQEHINRNIRRSLGVFSVPVYLSNGDPADKYGAGANSNRARPSLRDGLQAAVPHAWWRDNIDHERRSAQKHDPSRLVPALPPAAAASTIAPPPPSIAPLPSAMASPRMPSPPYVPPPPSAVAPTSMPPPHGLATSAMPAFFPPGASLAYYPAGVMQHDGAPHLLYMPCWVPSVTRG